MSEHVSESKAIRLYIAVYVALLVLLGATVGVAFINLGEFNIVIALIIAVIKALLFILFFMHVKDNNKLIWIFAGVGFLWMLFLYGGIFGDVFTRS
jgi:cytochrome c oxidase subunit IV